jgi:hypothetical protein
MTTGKTNQSNRSIITNYMITKINIESVLNNVQHMKEKKITKEVTTIELAQKILN